MYPLSTIEKPRITFRKSLRKGGSHNAELDPLTSLVVSALRETNEIFIVKVARRVEGTYWFSDRRVLLELEGIIKEQVRYHAVTGAHWMYKDLTDRIKLAALQSGEEGLIAMRQAHFDRIELESDHETVVLDGLGQSYWPTLHFFWWHR